MVFVDTGFSVVRNWLIGTSPQLSPGSGMVGTGSVTAAFTDTALGSPLTPTKHVFTTKTAKDKYLEYEYIVLSGDIITGSVVAEVGFFDNGNMFVRNNISKITLNGSVELQIIETINIGS